MSKISENNLETTTDKAKKSSRRDFFKRTAAYSVGAIAATNILAPAKLLADDENIVHHVEWGTTLGDELNKHPYGIPSAYEHNVVRRTSALLSSAGDMHAAVSMTPLHELEGIITPNGLHFTRTHNGVAHVDPNKFRLMIHGLVEKPIVLTLDELKKYPSESRLLFLECPANGAAEWKGPQFNSLQFVKGMMSNAEWTGVRLKTILDEIGLKPTAKWMLAEGSDGSEMSRTVPVEKVLDDAMIVWAQNGEALRPEQGYPVRLMLPGWEANLCVKWLKRLEFGAEPWYCKEETSKYTVLMPSGKAIQHFYPLEVNSIITTPCPEKPWSDLKKGDLVEVEGIAWSGHGTIKAVDISFDGGDNYVEASLKGLVLPKSWTRFSYMYRYEGKPLLLQSRAMDDAGFVQPSISQEKAIMGLEGVYHRNSICTWEVRQDGSVHNVQVRTDNCPS
ncbi:sulfite dehydrogenase [Sulfurimonas sp. CVO]|jgi:sulfane dehydrogenase subunit SoxC|uniref:Sulfite dehydrogenase n=1 Tax=Sulfurimonas xiamenensis TaxID=2590021 RepID=A0AAJ4A569_9BACT|nr:MULTISPECIES: sulfite dehydrogenase [Sulfurimonas]QFR44131.1 sulfite dehydrogenase [Sulfurimonas xiamenensis]QHG92083.1 sulfite dehydrogenase [Sulfurimonas sp. CVO]